MAEQTLNIPQILVFIILSALALRWFFSKPSGTGTRAASGQTRGNRVNPAQVDQIAQMFPQLSRREIMWDLQRNGGNVTATTERVLSGRGLDAPPASFQPPTPRSATPVSRTATPVSKPAHPDLITRYNLASKITPSPEASTTGSDSQKKGGWSADKEKRQQNLQQRREQMILDARRKMEEKERQKAAGKS